MRPPTQCALWKTPELANDHDFFEVVEVFGSEEHWSRTLRRCRECGQLYVHDFYEEMSFSGGEDYQSVTYIPVDTRDEINVLKELTVPELLNFYPRLRRYSADAVEWIKER